MQKRYSKYLRLLSYLLDVSSILILFPFFYKDELLINDIFFGCYLFLSWTILSFFIRFYQIYRFTPYTEILGKIVKQMALFLLLVIAFFPFYKSAIFSGRATAFYISSITLLVVIFKTAFFYYLKKYRIITGNNLRNIIIVGYNSKALDLKKIFETRTDYGYVFKGFFSDRKTNNLIKGKIAELKTFVFEEKIDEIFCSIDEITNEQQKELIDFCDENKVEIKFIPDAKLIFSKNMSVNHFEMFPVLSLEKSPLDNYYTSLFKRFFDVSFSLFVIVFLLSWLTPILGLLILLESKGPIFFKQSRPGLNEDEFLCYKFRSMRLNQTTEQEASRNDPRVTRIGKFIRKTSIDELPQFFNVLLGDMSIVGPRPHLWTQNKNYGKRIKKYMVRHHVKPGITGLAQVKGCRGEIETDEDMINRIKYDVFYIENWSFFLDIKIIIQTVINIFKGEEKAY
ncbi:undecaprenyl-phosphate glucose phosphotransferase [Flavobacterium sp. U410]